MGRYLVRFGHQASLIESSSQSSSPRFRTVTDSVSCARLQASSPRLHSGDFHTFSCRWHVDETPVAIVSDFDASARGENGAMKRPLRVEEQEPYKFDDSRTERHPNEYISIVRRRFARNQQQRRGPLVIRKRPSLLILLLSIVCLYGFHPGLFCLALQREPSSVASKGPTKVALDSRKRFWNDNESFPEARLSFRSIRRPSRWLRSANQRSWDLIESVRVRGGSNTARTPSLGLAASNSTLSALPPLNGLDRLLGKLLEAFGFFVVGRSLLTSLGNSADMLLDEIATRFMSEESVRALKMVRRIITRLGDHGVVDVFREYPSKDVIVAAKALSRLQRASAYYAERYRHVTKKVDDTELLEKLAYYSVFAKAAYGWQMDLALRGRLHLGDLKALLKQTGVKEDDVVETCWKGRTHRPAYFLVRDEKYRKLVLSIRGTWSARDLLTDLCCTGVDFGTATGIHNAHQGILEAARGVAQMTERTIEAELLAHPDYSLVVVGHSLGGACAAVLGTLWEHHFPGVSVYAYGCPCVGPMGKKPTMNDSIVSIVGEGDPFSSLSLGHIADTSFAIGALCEDDGLRSSTLVRTDGPVEDMPLDDLAWCYDTMQGLRKDVNGVKMYPPGRIFYISKSNIKNPDDSDGLDLREVPQEFFQDLKLHSRMLDVSRHVPTLYESYLQRLLSNMSSERASETK